MRTYFPNLRKLLMVSAIGAPVLMLQAFFSLISGAPGWAGVFFLMSILLGSVLPYSEIAKSAVEPPKGNLPLLGGTLKIVAVILMFAWLNQETEFRAFLNHLYETNAFADWRFVTALSLWVCYACLENWKSVRDLDDRTIYAYYAAKGGKVPQS